MCKNTFFSCYALKNVVIPYGVTSIGDGAFDNCTSLKTIIIGKNVETIYEMAFAGCASLTDVYYAGSETEWNEITIEDSNARLTDANIHYNYTA